MNGLVLSIFPGIDLLGKAFEEEGYCVVRGPDVLWGGDIYGFHPPVGVFEGVIGGPPCQAWSRLRRLLNATGSDVRHGNLIPEFERVVAEVRPLWFLMENVPEAPEPTVPDFLTTCILLNNRWVGGVQHRERRFVFGTANGLSLLLETVLFEAVEFSLAVTGDPRTVPVRLNGSGKPKRITVLAGHGQVGRSGDGGPRLSIGDACELQGLPRAYMDEAPFTMHGKRQVIGNAVPMPMGRAVAKAVKKATR